MTLLSCQAAHPIRVHPCSTDVRTGHISEINAESGSTGTLACYRKSLTMQKGNLRGIWGKYCQSLVPNVCNVLYLGHVCMTPLSSTHAVEVVLGNAEIR